MTHSEIELVVAARRGDVAAFALLARRHWPDCTPRHHSGYAIRRNPERSVRAAIAALPPGQREVVTSTDMHIASTTRRAVPDDDLASFVVALEAAGDGDTWSGLTDRSRAWSAVCSPPPVVVDIGGSG